MKKTILFSEKGKAISDFEVYQFVDEIFASETQHHFVVSSWIVIDEIRARVKENRVGDFEIAILIEVNKVQQPFNIDENGRSNDWDGVHHIWDDINDRLIM